LTADHKDESSVVLHCHDQHISKVGFTCDCNNLVSTSPYTEEPALQIPVPCTIALTAYVNRFTAPVYTAAIFFSSLRGPPAHGESDFI
jgi:hypothetical protein